MNEIDLKIYLLNPFIVLNHFVQAKFKLFDGIILVILDDDDQ